MQRQTALARESSNDGLARLSKCGVFVAFLRFVLFQSFLLFYKNGSNLEYIYFLVSSLQGKGELFLIMSREVHCPCPTHV